MTDFIIDKRDLQFILHEQLEVERLRSLPRYRELSREDFDIVLREAAKIGSELLAPLNAIGDEQGADFVDGRVKLADGFKAAYHRFCENGWLAPQGNAETGGQGLPLPVAVSIIEMFVAANSSFMFLPGLTGAAAHIIEN